MAQSGIFPDRRLPIDAKFPREAVLALFESNVEAEIEEARALDPLMSDVLRGRALVSFQLRNYKDMIEAGRQCVASDANSSTSRETHSPVRAAGFSLLGQLNRLISAWY